MGNRRHYFPVLSVQWRSGVHGVWCHSRHLRRHCGFHVASRDGFNVSPFACVQTQLNLQIFSDPIVGAQYRWSANFAPFAPRFWGLIQGALHGVRKKQSKVLTPYQVGSRLRPGGSLPPILLPI